MRISYFKKDGELITSSGFSTTSLLEGKWMTLSLDGSLINRLMEYVRFDVEIFGYDSIPIFIDNLNLLHKSNDTSQDREFSLNLPFNNTNSSLNDTTFFQWENINYNFCKCL